MSDLIPIATAGIEQTQVSRSASARSESAQIIDKATSLPSAATIQRSVNQAQSDGQVAATGREVVNNEQIRISSSLGQSNIRGNLSRERASELYEQIAKLI